MGFVSTVDFKPMKIICIARNYAAHAEELKNEIPSEPVFFIKPDSAVLHKNYDFYIPEFSQDIHYECEVVLKIDRNGKYVRREFAHRYFSEITLGIDFTARDLQSDLKKKGLPWEIAKSFDGAAVIGTFHKKEEFDLSNLNFELRKNNEIVQKGNTSLMIHDFDKIICSASAYFTLKMGDLLMTGTPEGVGKVESGDVLSGWLENKKVFEVKVK